MKQSTKLPPTRLSDHLETFKINYELRTTYLVYDSLDSLKSTGPSMKWRQGKEIEQKLLMCLIHFAFTVVQFLVINSQAVKN